VRVSVVLVVAALVVAALVVAALGIRLSHAEPESATLVYHAVPLRVEEKLSAGGDLLKVVLLGEAFLVSVPEAPRQVALRYLIRPEASARLSGKEVESLALTSALQGDGEVLKAAIGVGMTSPAAKEFESRELWQRLLTNTHMGPVVVEAVQAVSERAPEKRLCAASTAIEDTGASSFTSERVANTCVTRAISDTFEKLWGGYLGADLAEDLIRASVPFSKRGAARSETVASVESSLRSLTSSVEKVDPRRFEELLILLGKESEAVGVRPDLTLVRQVFLGRAVTTGAFRSAVEQLAKVPFEQRSSLTHSQLVKALQGLPSADWDVLLNSSVRPAIVRYVAKDEEFYSQWVSTHRRVIVDLVAAGKVDAAWNVAAALLKEDSVVASKVMSESAKLIVQGYLDQGSVQRAEQVASELAPWLPWTTRIKLSLARRGLAISALCGVLLGFAVAFKALVNKKRRQASVECSDARGVGEGGSTHTVAPETSTQADEASHSDQPTEKPLYSGEYVASLRLFGLEPGATLAQIKNAYRSAVKQYHPDRAGGGSPGDTDLFIRLTAEYEKLLELHDREAQRFEPTMPPGEDE